MKSKFAIFTILLIVFGTTCRANPFVTPMDFPKTIDDVPNEIRQQNERTGYMPFKNATPYQQIKIQSAADAEAEEKQRDRSLLSNEQFCRKYPNDSSCVQQQQQQQEESTDIAENQQDTTPPQENTTDEQQTEKLKIRTGIAILPHGYKKGDVIELSKLPPDYWWNKMCSDHVIWINLDDDASVNKAGQRVFTEFGGSDNEYFIDFPKGKSMRAFPGLILADVTASTEEQIVIYTDVDKAQTKAKAFAQALSDSYCSQDMNSVYLVAIDVVPTGDAKDPWAYVALTTGGAMTVIGIGAALATTTAVAATGSMALVNTTLALAGVASAIPVWGWITAGVLAAGAGIFALIPADLADIKQVMVLDDPIPIN